MGEDFLKVQNLQNKKRYQLFHQHPSNNPEAEGGCMVKERDFEAEQIQIFRKNEDIQL